MGIKVAVQLHTRMDLWLMVIDVVTRFQIATPKQPYSATLIAIAVKGLTGFKTGLWCPANAKAGSLNSKTRVG